MQSMLVTCAQCKSSRSPHLASEPQNVIFRTTYSQLSLRQPKSVTPHHYNSLVSSTSSAIAGAPRSPPSTTPYRSFAMPPWVPPPQASRPCVINNYDYTHHARPAKPGDINVGRDGKVHWKVKDTPWPINLNSEKVDPLKARSSWKKLEIPSDGVFAEYLGVVSFEGLEVQACGQEGRVQLLPAGHMRWEKNDPVFTAQKSSQINFIIDFDCKFSLSLLFNAPRDTGLLVVLPSSIHDP